jgi:hypothetical protein
VTRVRISAGALNFYEFHPSMLRNKNLRIGRLFYKLYNPIILMNFRLTKLKVIFSFIIPLVIFIVIIILSFYRLLIGLPNFFRYFFDLYETRKIFDIGNIILLLIEIVGVYLISSLFGKKEDNVQNLTQRIQLIVASNQSPSVPTNQPPAYRPQTTQPSNQYNTPLSNANFN